ncbi:MAG: hypothetical protein JXQ90_19005 [Cyclobacteriaceae bacterium]
MNVNRQQLFDFILRILASVLTLVGAFDLFLKLIEVLETKTGFEFSYWDAVATIYKILIYTGFALGILWSIYIDRKEELSASIQNYSQIFIRIWLAFLISTYGFAKILKTQFQVPEHIKDIPMSAQHPFNLTWYYFGFSREYALILAMVEIGGSLLLLFRKTRLLGAALLFPAMLNIVFINKYYYINPWSYFASILFTLGTLYLLLIDYDKLKNCFLDFGLLSRITFTHIWKGLLKAMVIAASFGLICMYANDSQPNKTFLKGVWSVESMEMEGDSVIYPNNRDSVLTKLYFEYASPGRTILEFNHHFNRKQVNYRLSQIWIA